MCEERQMLPCAVASIVELERSRNQILLFELGNILPSLDLKLE